VFGLLSQRVRYTKDHDKRKKISSYLSSLLMIFLIILPDIIAKLTYANYSVQWISGELIYAYIFILFLQMSWNNILTYVVFGATYLAQLNYWINYIYNQSLLTPYNFVRIFSDIENFNSEFTKIILGSIFSLGFIYWLIYRVISNFDTIRIKNKLAYLPLLGMLCYGGFLFNKHSEIDFYMPKFAQYSGFNAIRSALGYIKYNSHDNAYFPYEVYTKNIEGRKNIVLVMVENLNPKHMQLLGYSRDNTPFLKSLSGDERFVAKYGLAAATSNEGARKLFFNAQAEPLNTDLLENNANHLLVRAKNQGFKTFFISSQSDKILTHIKPENLDYKITASDAEELFAKKYEETMPLLLKNLKLGEKNFIILYFNSLKAPYSQSYEYRRADFEKYSVLKGNADAMLNSYDNAVFYVDSVLAQIFGVLKNYEYGAQIFVTSDAVNFMDKKYDNNLERYIVNAQIPMIYYCYNCDNTLAKKMDKLYAPSHYDLAKLIAAELGYFWANPNTADDVSYIQTEELMDHKNGIIKIKRDVNKKQIEYSPITFE
jgi:glucan phosphoethanolaminetransferase (alkaline phosphatase superfamily)